MYNIESNRLIAILRWHERRSIWVHIKEIVDRLGVYLAGFSRLG